MYYAYALEIMAYRNLVSFRLINDLYNKSIMLNFIYILPLTQYNFFI